MSIHRVAEALALCAVLSFFPAHAQPHRCIGGEGQPVVSKHSCSDLGLHRAPDGVTRAPGSRNCMDPSAILSLELDTKTTGISAAERRVRVANYARARNCQPLLSEFQKEQLRSQYSMQRYGGANDAATAAGASVGGSPAPGGPRSAINVRSGQVMPGVAGGVIDPRSGTFHQDVGGGYVNSRTGQFSPKH